MVLEYNDRGISGTDGTIRLKYSEFCGQIIPVGARLSERDDRDHKCFARHALSWNADHSVATPADVAWNTAARVKFGDNWGAVYLTLLETGAGSA